MSWLRQIAATAKPLHAVSVLKGTSAPVASPVIASKPHVDTHKMCVTAVLTTRLPDRQGDIVDPTGGDFEEHRYNPVVLFHHGKDHKLPIGKAEDPDGNYSVRLVKARDGDLLLGTTYFSQSNKFAQDVFGLVAEDVLRGVSIGFDPQADADAVEELGPSPILERPALHFKAWKLLEYSHTPIGVNRDALTVAVQKSLDGSRKLHPVLEKALAPLAQPRKTVVSTAGAGFEKGDGCRGMSKAQRTAVALDKARKAGKKVPPPPGVKKAMPQDYDNDGDDDTTPGGDTDQDYAGADAGGDDYGSDVSGGGGGDQGFDPARDEPSADPNLPPGMAGDQDNTPPTVAALLDGSQGLMDLASQLEAAVKKGEHPGGRKYCGTICEQLRSLAAKMKAKGEGIHAELNGGGSADNETDENAGDEGGESDEDKNATEESGDEPEPETDDEGALVTKGGYTPRRFTFAGSDVLPVSRAPAGDARRVKALERENAELQKALKQLLDDVEAGRNRR